MRRILGAALLVAAAAAQVTWAPRLETGGAFPNLVLLAVVAVAWTRGVRAGLVWACIGGLLLDLTAPGAIGPHAVALMAGVYVIGFWIRNLERPSMVHAAVTAAVTTLIYSVILAGADDAAPAVGVVAQLAVAASIFNAVLAPFALEIVRRIDAIGRTAKEAT